MPSHGAGCAFPGVEGPGTAVAIPVVMHRWLCVSLVSLATAFVSTGCALDTEEEEEETEETALTESELKGGGSIEVVQFNPYYGGAWPKWEYSKDKPRSGTPNWETAETFSRLLKQQHPNAAVIGMQEMDSQRNADEMRNRLGASWRVKWYGGDKQTGSAIYWRDDVVSFEKDFGKHAVNHYDRGGGRVAVMFGGALLQKKGGPKFGFFTGKLTPRTFTDDNEKDDEARSLTAWIKSEMAPFPNSSRIITVDQNDFYGGLAFDAFRKTFSTPKDDTPTWKSPNTGNWHRYDYIWWDYDNGAKRSGGFIGKSDVMGGSGSDHRAIISRVLLK